jgi:hypothetical protein
VKSPGKGTVKPKSEPAAGKTNQGKDDENIVAGSAEPSEGTAAVVTAVVAATGAMDDEDGEHHEDSFPEDDVLEHNVSHDTEVSGAEEDHEEFPRVATPAVMVDEPEEVHSGAEDHAEAEDNAHVADTSSEHEPDEEDAKAHHPAENDIEHMVRLLEAPGISAIVPEDLVDVDEIPDED